MNKAIQRIKILLPFIKKYKFYLCTLGIVLTPHIFVKNQLLGHNEAALFWANSVVLFLVILMNYLLSLTLIPKVKEINNNKLLLLPVPRKYQWIIISSVSVSVVVLFFMFKFNGRISMQAMIESNPVQSEFSDFFSINKDQDREEYIREVKDTYNSFEADKFENLIPFLKYEIGYKDANLNDKKQITSEYIHEIIKNLIINNEPSTEYVQEAVKKKLPNFPNSFLAGFLIEHDSFNLQKLINKHFKDDPKEFTETYKELKDAASWNFYNSLYSFYSMKANNIKRVDLIFRSLYQYPILIMFLSFIYLINLKYNYIIRSMELDLDDKSKDDDCSIKYNFSKYIKKYKKKDQFDQSYMVNVRDESNKKTIFIYNYYTDIGFIGTLVGIVLAIKLVPNVLAASEHSQTIAAITDVCFNLAIAFDTTLLALLCKLFSTTLINRNDFLEKTYFDENLSEFIK